MVDKMKKKLKKFISKRKFFNWTKNMFLTTTLV